MSATFISVEGLTRRFPDATGGGQLTVFEDLWFTVADSEFCLRDRPLRLRQVHHPQYSRRSR